ncbi:MAG TPA: glycerophosphodiester phosphodiesterase family protein [Sphingomonas sp.]
MRSSPFGLLDRRLAAAPERARVSFLLARDIAHRGLWGRGVPENSLAAAREAITRGFAIECDVRLAGDGSVVVFHDADAGRLCGRTGRIAAMNAEAITMLRLDRTDEPVPRLADLLALIAGRVPLLIEVKTEGPAAGALCLGVRRALEGYRGPAAVMGFNPEVSRWFARHAPRIVRGLVMEEKKDMLDPLRRRLAVLRARPDFLAYDIRALPSALPSALRRHGLPVLSWTVRTPAQRAIAAAHADRPIFEQAA